MLAQLSLFWLSSIAAVRSVSTSSACLDVSIALNSSELNARFTSLFDASGIYIIAATYCEPLTTVASRQDTLQILLHGAAYNRTYWSSLGLDIDTYNWVKYARGRGYTTLAIDRLCNGASSHPSGLSCQIPSEAEILHQLVQQARNGRLPAGESTRRFNKIVMACHSVGGDICNYNAATRPDDADALVLTGWSSKLANGVPSTAFGGIAPASLVYPSRYADLGLSYLTFGLEFGQRYLSYYGDYDPALAHDDYLHQGTFTFGEASTAMQSQRQSPDFKGPVFLLVGNEDATYCQPNMFSALTMSVGNCSNGIASGTREYFPGASTYGFAVIPNTGHNVNLHRTAPTAFKAVFDFLDQNGI